MRRNDLRGAGPAQRGLLDTRLPRPDIARPELRQNVQRRRVAAAIGGDDFHQNVVGRRLCVGDLDIEVAVVVEDTGVEQFEFRLVGAAPPVLCHQLRIGKGLLRILVEHPHPAVARGAVEVVVELLDVLAVIALRIGQPEQALLEDRVALVPQRKPEAQMLLVVTEPGDAVLAPAIGATARVIMRQILPGVAVLAVVLAHGAPLPFAQIRPPAPPRRSVPRLGEPPRLRGIGQIELRFRRALCGHWSAPDRWFPVYRGTRAGVRGPILFGYRIHTRAARGQKSAIFDTNPCGKTTKAAPNPGRSGADLDPFNIREEVRLHQSKRESEQISGAGFALCSQGKSGASRNPTAAGIRAATAMAERMSAFEWRQCGLERPKWALSRPRPWPANNRFRDHLLGGSAA